jgi:hypothetical protein
MRAEIVEGADGADDANGGADPEAAPMGPRLLKAIVAQMASATKLPRIATVLMFQPRAELRRSSSDPEEADADCCREGTSLSIKAFASSGLVGS